MSVTYVCNMSIFAERGVQANSTSASAWVGCVCAHVHHRFGGGRYAESWICNRLEKRLVQQQWYEPTDTAWARGIRMYMS
jgi:hypothetical protein